MVSIISNLSSGALSVKDVLGRFKIYKGGGEFSWMTIDYWFYEVHAKPVNNTFIVSIFKFYNI